MRDGSPHDDEVERLIRYGSFGVFAPQDDGVSGVILSTRRVVAFMSRCRIRSGQASAGRSRSRDSDEYRAHSPKRGRTFVFRLMAALLVPRGGARRRSRTFVFRLTTALLVPRRERYGRKRSRRNRLRSRLSRNHRDPALTSAPAAALKQSSHAAGRRRRG
jgi:hypothetical protein